MSNGINYFGSSDTADGIGRAAALNTQCLEKANIPFDSHILSRPVALQSGRDTIIDAKLLGELKHRTNIFHFSARWVPHYFSHLGDQGLKGFYNIGYWVCEVPRIPNQWARQLEFFDEIWTASTFCQTAIARVANIPVVRIPHPIEQRELSSRIAGRATGGPFTFLTIFNAYSDAERKNPLFTIRAFLNAHANNPDVRLIVKVGNLEHDTLLAQKLTAISQQHRNITVIEGYVATEVVQALYDQTDVYVSLHRAEGFGLTISDAMSRGIPVITTGYSGNMEFCQADDTRLVSFSPRPIGHERLRYRKDDIWAEPDMADAVQAFSELVRDYPIWLRKAARARTRITTSLSIDAVGQLMRERLDLINSKFSYINDMSDRSLEREVGIYDTYGF
jgi:glycosyltransferase involved in cell wall biosynthesis